MSIKNLGILSIQLNRIKIKPFEQIYARIGSHPLSDLKRGYSYPMGEFGNEEQAHEGLSGYSITNMGITDALKRLDKRMGIWGKFIDKTNKEAKMFVTIFIGSDRGRGVDGEDLFKPHKILINLLTSKFSSRDSVIQTIDEKLKNILSEEEYSSIS